jgi:hypothetical protein
MTGNDAGMAPMGSFAEIQVVQVTTDNLVRGIPKKQLWIAAAPSDQAVQLVLAVIPEGWTARLADGHLTAREVQLLKLPPGEVREPTE